jgi:hypothetical protein
MAVAYDAQSESHTGTTGNTSSSSFSWTHTPSGTPRGVVVFVLTVGAFAGGDYSTSVTYGGQSMSKVPYTARDGDTEIGQVAAYWMTDPPSGAQTVVVNRTNNQAAMYAAAYTVTAAGQVEVPSSLVKTRAASGAEQTGASASGSGVSSSWSSMTLDDGSTSGTNSLRFMGVYSGAASVSTASTNTTAGPSIDFGNYVFATYRQTSASTGATALNITTAISDDLAVLGLAVRETVGRTKSIVSTGGGVSTVAPAGAHNASIVSTGGGAIAIDAVAFTGAVEASIVSTGGGVAATIGQKNAQATVAA